MDRFVGSTKETNPCITVMFETKCLKLFSCFSSIQPASKETNVLFLRLVSLCV